MMETMEINQFQLFDDVDCRDCFGAAFVLVFQFVYMLCSSFLLLLCFFVSRLCKLKTESHSNRSRAPVRLSSV